MATPALIVAKTLDGNYGTVYCHYDGYPEWTLRILEADYSNQFKINQLILSGDMSCIESEVSNCRFYGGKLNQAYITSDAGIAKRYSSKPPVSYGYFWDGKSWSQFTPYNRRKG